MRSDAAATEVLMQANRLDGQNGTHYRFWNPVKARFTPAAEPIIWALPAVLTAFILITSIIHLRLRRKLARPTWLSNIIDSRPDPLQPVDHSRRRSRSPAAWLTLVSFAGIVLEVVKLLAFHSRIIGKVEPILLLIAWFLVIALLALKRSRTASPLLLFCFICICIAQFVRPLDSSLSWTPDHHDLPLSIIPNALAASTALLGMVIILRLPMNDPRLSTEDVSPAFSTPTNDKRSPEDIVTLWQFLSVSWMAPLINVGYVRQLHEADVWTLSYQFLHQPLHDRFKAVEGSMIWRLVKANGLDLFITTTLGLIDLLTTLAVPVILQQLLRSMQDQDSPRSATVKYAAMILLAELISAQTGQLQTWYCRRSYERSRGQMITTMYEKVMSRKMSLVGSGEIVDDPKEMQARVKASKGKILNLLRGDCYHVAQRFWDIPELVQNPIGLVLSIILVWKIIGWPCLLGMVTVILAQLINAFLIRLQLKLERRRRAITDTKLQRTGSLIEAIRHLRWYGWQDSWLANIMDARQRELNMRIATGLCNIVIGSVNNLASMMFPVVAFLAYTKLAGLDLTVDVAFPALSLFGMLDEYLRAVPNLITTVLDAYIAVDRLQAFLEEEDKPGEKAPVDAQLQLKDASFAWPGTKLDVLTNISLSFPVGLSIITGKVGSGKTALLQAILGEMDLRDGGLVCPEGSIAYCAQIPWLESKSIRDNILFAQPYEDARYKQTIEACALVADFTTFQHGDLTNIGENGIGLSGGQKARVALARAVYSQAGILLLDDPLSALDLTTSRHIVDHCFRGSLLSGRTTLLITNHEELMQAFAVQAIEIGDGRAAARTIEPDSSDGHAAATIANGHTNGPVKEAAMNEAVLDKFFEDEYRAHGGIKLNVYWQYIKAGKLYLWFFLVLVMATVRFLAIFKSWFLKEWGEAYGTERQGGKSSPLSFLQRLPSPEDNVNPWLWWFFALNMAQAFCSFGSRVLMLVVVYAAGKRLFREVMESVCHATFKFYDVTPSGRLMNRMTGDINILDGNISYQFQSLVSTSIRWLFAIIVIASVTPVFLLVSVILVCLFVYFFSRFLPTSQSLRRLETVSLSPLITDFGALMEGLVTIRAFCVQQRFQERLFLVVDNFQGMDHFYWSLQAWLQYRFDIISASSSFVLTLLAIFTDVTPGMTAFVLLAANRLVRATHALCKQYGNLQMDFVSVERVIELLDLEQEPKGDVKPPASWPTRRGDIEFSNLTIRYRPNLDPALQDVSFSIPASSKVALVGRTGCGKTTLALSLLATLPPEAGHIIIDGIDIAGVDKQILRSRITFLAQEPVLFPGTIRENLDPLLEHSDDECMDVLERTCSGYGWTLATHVETGGKNLSQGQRQLVALARALLRRSEIVIMDEATASIDTVNAARIQEMIRTELKESTVITIAHRVEAIRSADIAVVLQQGKLLEIGKPEDVLSRAGGRIAEELEDTRLVDV